MAGERAGIGQHQGCQAKSAKIETDLQKGHRPVSFVLYMGGGPSAGYSRPAARGQAGLSDV